jgi:hypothetical protein
MAVKIVGEVTKAVFGFNYWWLLWITLIGVVLFLVISTIRNKAVFKYPVRIFKTREGGAVKEQNCKGGYIGRKNSASFFQIKLGMMPWQKVNLNTTPNPKYMDQDNRVYYKQIDLGTYIQLQRHFDKDVISFSGVEQDVKYGAILDIQRIKEILRTDSPWKKLAPYFALVLIFIFGILAFWFVTNGKCPSVG